MPAVRKNSCKRHPLRMARKKRTRRIPSNACKLLHPPPRARTIKWSCPAWRSLPCSSSSCGTSCRSCLAQGDRGDGVRGGGLPAFSPSGSACPGSRRPNGSEQRLLTRQSSFSVTMRTLRHQFRHEACNTALHPRPGERKKFPVPRAVTSTVTSAYDRGFFNSEGATS